MTTTLVIVMAKAPRAGLAKTRLAPQLSAAGAARLAAVMLRHALCAAADAGLGPVVLCAAPDEHDAQLQAAAGEVAATLWPQGDGDLGARLSRAAERGLTQADALLLMGTDAPALDAAMLRSAAQALLQHDAVLVPAADGGYVLLGLRRTAPALFEGIAWSTAEVLEQTRQALRGLGWSHTELATVHDVDEPADLVHVPSGWWAEAGLPPPP